MIMPLIVIAAEVFSVIVQRFFAQTTLVQKKHGILKELLVWGIFFLFTNGFTYIITSKEWNNIFVFAVSFFIVLRVMYKDSMWTLLFTTVFMAAAGVLAEFMVFYGWMLLTNKSELNITNNNNTYFLIVLTKVVWFCFIKVVLLFVKQRKGIELNIQDIFEIFCVSGGSIIILVALFFRQGEWRGILDFFAVVVVMFINILVYFLYEKIKESTEKRVREELLQAQCDCYMRQCNENELLWIEFSEFRHNMKERYLLEQMYLEQKNYDALQEYCKTNLQKLLGKKRIADTGNIYFDGIINYKAEIAEKHSITLKTDLVIPQDIEVNVDDMWLCLGNLLDNAIEASKKLVEEKVIWVMVKIDGDNIIIVVANQYVENRKKKGEKYLTTKADNRGEHGLGLNIVERIVNKYNGTMTIQDNNNIFEVSILMYNVLV